MNDAMSEPASTMRLQRFLARAGVASRRKSEKLIEAGRISVNGNVVTELGTKIDPAVDIVEFDGASVRLSDNENPVVIMLNKPRGFVTTMGEAQGEGVRTVEELLPMGKHPSLFYIGRLDKDTTGLLLFTDDGDLGNSLTHPSHGVEKCYIAHIDGCLSDIDIESLTNGIMLDGRMTAPATVEVLETMPDSTQYVSLTIHEGRNRQVRRMFAALGHEVIDLERVSFGPLSLDDLASGTWRYLDEGEIRDLYSSCGLGGRI